MGYLLGLISSGAFGLIPLFTLPLLARGVSVETCLFYRFALATITMGIFLLLRKEHLAVRGIELLKIAGLSLFYLLAVVIFFHAFAFLPSGVVATIQFLYPVMVLLIMIGFFHERFHWHVGVALGLAICGVMLLSIGSGPNAALEAGAGPMAAMPRSGSDIFWGVLLSLLAGLFNALYFVGIQAARIPNINGLGLTFYVMLFGAIFCFFNAIANSSLQWISHPLEIFLATMLALVTAVLSNLTLILAIKRIGPTMVSILGVMEPLTAVTVGIFVFREPFTPALATGITLIIFSVMLVIIAPLVLRSRGR